MSYGQTPGGEQEDPAGQRPGFGAPPPYPGQGGYGPPGYGSPEAPPSTYRGWGVAASICGVLFNLILGFPAALIGRRYGNKVTELWARGDRQAAVSASRKARGWLIASTVLSALGLILTVVVFAAAATSQGQFSKPSAVAASIKTQLQQRISNSSSQYYEPGVSVTSVVCTSSNGQTGTETAVVAKNGASYSTR